jgi:hypothetical protein
MNEVVIHHEKRFSSPEPFSSLAIPLCLDPLEHIFVNFSSFPFYLHEEGGDDFLPLRQETMEKMENIQPYMFNNRRYLHDFIRFYRCLTNYLYLHFPP